MTRKTQKTNPALNTAFEAAYEAAKATCSQKLSASFAAYLAATGQPYPEPSYAPVKIVRGEAWEAHKAAADAAWAAFTDELTEWRRTHMTPDAFAAWTRSRLG